MTLKRLQSEIVRCRKCPRLVQWPRENCTGEGTSIAQCEYWGKPNPGFGDPKAELLLIGLAPARPWAVIAQDGWKASTDIPESNIESELAFYRALFTPQVFSAALIQQRSEPLSINRPTAEVFLEKLTIRLYM